MNNQEIAKKVIDALGGRENDQQVLPTVRLVFVSWSKMKEKSIKKLLRTWKKFKVLSLTQVNNQIHLWYRYS